MFGRNRKVKAMAPQTETVELPDIIEPVQENDGWMFPKHWSDQDIADWLVTHPSDRTPPQVVTIKGDLGEGPPATVCEEVNGDLLEDRDEYEKTYDQQLAEENAAVASGLKANGVYAAAFALPMDLQDKVTSENYNPEEFFLVHMQVWNELVDATHAEAELGIENKELRKQLNAQKRGMRKVNRHWSETKRQLRRLANEWQQDRKGWTDGMNAVWNQHTEDLKKRDIFATRLARRLRKARAGRDKRERQLAQAHASMKTQDLIIAKQAEYIERLEAIVNGQFDRRS